MTETHTERRTRIEATADAFRARGSKLARRLLAEYRATEAAVRPVDRKVTGARFDAACATLAALYGCTPTAVDYAVRFPARDAGAAPGMTHGAGGNLDLLAWEATTAEAIDTELAKLAP